MKTIDRIVNLTGKLSIKNKLIVTYTLLLFLVALFIFIYFPSQVEKQAKSDAIAKLKTISEIAAYSISSALDFDDKETISDYLISVNRNKSIVFIIVHNHKDIIVYSNNLNEATAHNYSLAKQGVYYSEDGTILESVTPVYQNDKLLGKLFIGMSLNEVNEGIAKARGSIALVSFFTLLIGFLIIYILSTLVTVPLNKLTKTIDEISIGDLSKRAFIGTSDEVGQLANSFNIMLDKLELAYKSLKNEIDIRMKTEKDLNKAKEDLTKALEQEKELNELRNRFVSMVSHEYRTPLTAILSSTYLLDNFYKKGMNTEFEKQLKVIQTSVNDMTQLLEDVLAIGKIDADKKIPKNDELDLYDIINEQIVIVNVMDKSKHNIYFINNSKYCKVISNKKVLIHIISNLLLNATKYSPADTDIKVELYNDNSDIVLSVKDEGIGIEKEDIDDIFEPFIRGSNVGVIQGTGLGLTIVKKSVEALGYRIEVESEKGKGANFMIFISNNHS